MPNSFTLKPDSAAPTPVPACPSSPVVGTNLSGVMSDNKPTPLSGNMTGDAWQALANAAQALLLVAHAHLGHNLSTPVNLSPLHTLAGHTDLNAGYSVAEAINDFLVAKARAQRSDRYLRAIKNSLSKFCRGRGHQALTAVTPEQIEIWLMESTWAPRTKEGYLSDVSILYNFGIRRGWCSNNPAKAVELPDAEDSIIGIHTPEQTRVVMDLARATDLNIMRCLALRYFAGMRAIEAECQQEEDIKAADGTLIVTRAKRRTRARRRVTVLPVLSAWLAVGGSLPLRDTGRRMAEFAKAVEAAGVPWPQNAPRHSFCSYHLAQWENAGKTALEAGHSEQMLFHHYRALVTKADAAKFWAIYPTPSIQPPNQNAL